MTQYPQWVAPAEDGGAMVWPAPPQLLAEARQNNAMLGLSQARIQNVPLSEARREMRRWLGHGEDDQLFIGTGHQAELCHPGVWAKDVVIHLAAETSGGSACHFAVDTDEPKHLDLRWPGESHPLTDDPALRTARWCGRVATPTAAHLNELKERLAIAQSRWSFRPLLGGFLDALGEKTTYVPVLASALTEACHAIDQSLGLRHRAMVTSPIWGSRPYLL
ncbi:MAG: hypothetical protein K8T91_00780, partial [Planctomycetes bacterium]|nr:hypothetical protein [Planctomycetota bacterium]